MQLNHTSVEKWDLFEITLKTEKTFDNPFVEGILSARFTNGDRVVEAAGFYDGEGTWKIRFMPEHTGTYTFVTRSNMPDLQDLSGEFVCTAPTGENHGPVRVWRKYHFAYADGTPYFPMGTTAYAWTTSPEPTRRQTVEEVAKYRFNKLRMGFFPKRLQGLVHIDITYDPPVLPYEGKRGMLDLKRFNVEYFREFEREVLELQKRGIEADVILFHFYDFGFWGINPGLTDEEDLLYVRYIAARLSALRNVWWCLANEYDLLLQPTSQDTHTLVSVSDRKDWDAIGRALRQADPYNHPRSIHNFTTGHIPDYDWMTHAAFQNGNTYELVLELKRRYGKPAIADEYGYEGNITGSEWGDQTPESELERHVRAVMAGGYATHGESYIVNGNNRDIFWAYGGKMVSESAPRLKFFRGIMESCPYWEMEPEIAMLQGSNGLCLRKGTEEFLLFFRRPDKKPGFTFISTDMAEQYHMTIYDLWECTKTDCGTATGGRVLTELPEWAVVKLVAVEKQ